MNKNKDENEIWDQVISYVNVYPIDFQKLESYYDIGKLQLQKFTSVEVRAKQREFQLRYCKQLEQTSKTWMENEYRLFMWFILAYFKMKGRKFENLVNSKLMIGGSEDWQLLGRVFKKQCNVCKYFYLCSIKSKTQNWQQEQDQIIKGLMKSNLSKKWTDIGLELFKQSNGRSFRKPKAIRERWLSHLNPEIKKQVFIYLRAEWTLEEELDLLQKIRENGRKWSKIAKILGNRSEHTVKNRFNKIKQRYERQMLRWQKVDEYTEFELIDFLVNEYKKKIFLNMEKQENERKILNGCEETILCSMDEVKIEVQHIEMNFIQGQMFQPIVLIFPNIAI